MSQPYIILVESGSDIPMDLARKYNIEVVKMHVTMGETTLNDMEFPVEDVFDYYEKTKVIPTTSGCNPEDFNVILDQIHEKYPDHHILHLAYSAVTTCSFQSAVIASENRSYVTSIDTQFVSVGHLLIALAIANYIMQHLQASIEDIKEKVRSLSQRVHMGFLPGDLDYLKAGGRVTNTQYLGAKLLNLKPLIEIENGYLISTKRYRGSMKITAAKLVEEFASKYNLKKDFLFCIHSKRLDESVKTRVNQVIEEIGFKHHLWIETGCVISTHAGPGTFGIVGLSDDLLTQL